MKRWKVSWLGLALVTALLVVACGPRPAAAPAAQEPVASQPESGRCGDRSKLSNSVSFYNWSDYMDPEILTMFEEECGVKVVYDTYSSNEDLLAKLQAGATGYDLIIPSDYMVSIMMQLNLLRELDHANIPNLANLGEKFSDVPYDPGQKFSIPYQWGTAGIGYDADFFATPPDSLAVIFDPEQAQAHAGKILLLNDAREVIGAALKYLGYPLNATDPAQLEEAKQVILAIKPYLVTFDSDTFADLLVAGEVVVGQMWNGNVYAAIFDNPDANLGYVIPKEGLSVYIDNMAIPASAPNPYTAEVLINYLLDPEIGAMITNATYYASPNEAALPYIVDEIKNDPGIFPPDEVLARMEYFEDVGEASQLYERIWTEIKSQ